MRDFNQDLLGDDKDLFDDEQEDLGSGEDDNSDEEKFNELNFDNS